MCWELVQTTQDFLEKEKKNTGTLTGCAGVGRGVRAAGDTPPPAVVSNDSAGGGELQELLGDRLRITCAGARHVLHYDSSPSVLVQLAGRKEVRSVLFNQIFEYSSGLPYGVASKRVLPSPGGAEPARGTRAVRPSVWGANVLARFGGAAVWVRMASA